MAIAICMEALLLILFLPPSPRDAKGVLHRTRAPVAALHREIRPLPFDLSLWVQPERPPLQGSLH